MAEMLSYAPDLRSITQGQGDYTLEFLRYEEVPAHLAQRVVAGGRPGARSRSRLSATARSRRSCDAFAERALRPATLLGDDNAFDRDLPAGRGVRRVRPAPAAGRAARRTSWRPAGGGPYASCARHAPPTRAGCARPTSRAVDAAADAAPPRAQPVRPAAAGRPPARTRPARERDPRASTRALRCCSTSGGADGAAHSIRRGERSSSQLPAQPAAAARPSRPVASAPSVPGAGRRRRSTPASTHGASPASRARSAPPRSACARPSTWSSVVRIVVAWELSLVPLRGRPERRAQRGRGRRRRAPSSQSSSARSARRTPSPLESGAAGAGAIDAAPLASPGTESKIGAR